MCDIVWVSPQGHRSVSVSCHFLLIERILQITSRASADEWVFFYCDLSETFVLYLFHQSDTFVYGCPSSNCEVYMRTYQTFV